MVRPLWRRCPSERWWRLKVKVSSGTSSGFVRTFAEGMNDSSASEPKPEEELFEYSWVLDYYCLWKRHCSLHARKQFLLHLPTVIFGTSFQWPIKSLRPRLPRAALAFSSHFVVLAVLSHAHPLFRGFFFFFVPLDFLIYVKLGLLGPQGTLLVFFLFIPKTEICPRSRAAVRREQPAVVSGLFPPCFCVSAASKHKSELKSSFVSQSEAAAFSFRPLSPGLIPPPPYQCAQASVWQR